MQNQKSVGIVRPSCVCFPGSAGRAAGPSSAGRSAGGGGGRAAPQPHHRPLSAWPAFNRSLISGRPQSVQRWPVWMVSQHSALPGLSLLARMEGLLRQSEHWLPHGGLPECLTCYFIPNRTLSNQQNKQHTETRQHQSSCKSYFLYLPLKL